MRKSYILAAVALLATAVSTAPAAIINYVATLDGPTEGVVSPGTGNATFTVNTTAHTIVLHVTFTGLTSGTTASHIHSATSAALTGTAGVATTTPTFTGFPLGVTSGTYDTTLDLTSAASYNPAYVTANGGTNASAETALLAGIAAREAYLNIHTSNFPGGEIRGFLVPVPEPASLSVLLAGSALLALRRRRAR